MFNFYAYINKNYTAIIANRIFQQLFGIDANQQNYFLTSLPSEFDCMKNLFFKDS